MERACRPRVRVARCVVTSRRVVIIYRVSPRASNCGREIEEEYTEEKSIKRTNDAFEKKKNAKKTTTIFSSENNESGWGVTTSNPRGPCVKGGTCYLPQLAWLGTRLTAVGFWRVSRGARRSPQARNPLRARCAPPPDDVPCRPGRSNPEGLAPAR